MKILHHPQGSEQWLRCRKGIPTASRFGDIVTPAKCEVSKSARKYMIELLADRITTDLPPDFAGNRWTDRGTEWEPEARRAFAAETGLEVAEVGFCVHDTHLTGCSPDGLILDPVTLEYVAGLEIKCKSPNEHAQIVLDGEMPADFKPQVHGGMIVTGLDAWHFYAFCPGMRSFHQVILRDDYTAKLEAALAQFAVEFAAFNTWALGMLTLS